MYRIAYISYNHNLRTLKIKGNFGKDFKKEVNTALNKHKRMPRPKILNNTTFEFYIHYLLEMIFLLKAILPKQELNKKNITEVIRYLTNLEKYTISLIRKKMIGSNGINFHVVPRQKIKQKVIKPNKYKAHVTSRNIVCENGHDLHVDTLIKIPNGWAHIEDIRIGDTVIGKNGNTTIVTGINPVAARQLYTVHFVDGRAIVAGGLHLWEVYLSINGSMYSNNAKMMTLSTLEIIDFISIYENKCYIDLILPEQSTEKYVPIPPYLLGSMVSGCMLNSKYIWYNANETEYFKILEKYLISGYGFFPHGDVGYELRPADENSLNYYLLFLDNLGLKAIKNKDKFIPKAYLEASEQQRWELLQGIFDAGLIENDNNTIAFLTLSENLANDVVYLIRSLGGIAKVTIKKIKVSDKDTSSHRVLIWHNKTYNFFKLSSKLKAFSFATENTEHLKLQITEITKAGISNSKCIAVDSPDKLYVVENFIVTKFNS